MRPTQEPATRRGVVQRALARMYVRLGARVLLVALAGGLVVVLLVGLIEVVWSARYLRLSLSEFAVQFAIGVAGFVPALAIAAVASRDFLRTGLSWSGDGRTAERAPQVWVALIRAPAVVSRRAALATSIAMVPLAVAVTAVADAPAYAVVPIAVAGIGGILAAAVLVTFGAELTLRPMVEDVAAMLPPGFEPAAATWRLSQRTLAPLPVVTFFVAMTAGAFAGAGGSGTARLSIALGIGLAAAGAAALGFLVITRSVLDPLDDLLAATRRVREGDIATRVPVVTADDLGQLAHSFNEMLDGLRERETLRARLATAADDERRRVERDLHDGAQQRLVTMALWLDVLQAHLRDDELKTVAERLSHELDGAIAELRELTHGGAPAVVVEQGLDVALRTLAERAPGSVRLRGEAGGGISPAVAATAYFVAAEGVTNAVRHSAAGVVELVVERDGDRLRIEVRDDGVGGALSEGSGLRGLRDRLAEGGGRLTVESPPGAGTVLRAELPVELVSDRRGPPRAP